MQSRPLNANALHLLRAELAALREEDFDLDLIGFEDDELARGRVMVNCTPVTVLIDAAYHRYAGGHSKFPVAGGRNRPGGRRSC
jgi:hypothetical protein